MVSHTSIRQPHHRCSAKHSAVPTSLAVQSTPNCPLRGHWGAMPRVLLTGWGYRSGASPCQRAHHCTARSNDLHGARDATGGPDIEPKEHRTMQRISVADRASACKDRRATIPRWNRRSSLAWLDSQDHGAPWRCTGIVECDRKVEFRRDHLAVEGRDGEFSTTQMTIGRQIGNKKGIKRQIALVANGNGTNVELHSYVRNSPQDPPALNAILTLDYMMDREHSMYPLLERLIIDGLMTQEDMGSRRASRFDQSVLNRERTPLCTKIPFEEDLAPDTMVPAASLHQRYQNSVTSSSSSLLLAVQLQLNQSGKLVLQLPSCVPFSENARCFVSLDEEGCLHIRSWEPNEMALGRAQWEELESCARHDGFSRGLLYHQHSPHCTARDRRRPGQTSSGGTRQDHRARQSSIRGARDRVRRLGQRRTDGGDGRRRGSSVRSHTSLLVRAEQRVGRHSSHPFDEWPGALSTLRVEASSGVKQIEHKSRVFFLEFVCQPSVWRQWQRLNDAISECRNNRIAVNTEHNDPTVQMT